MSQINLGVNTNATDRPMHIVVYREGDSVTLGGTNSSNASFDTYDLTVQLARLTQRLDAAEAKIVELEKRMLVAPARSPWFGAAASGIAGVDVRRLSEAPPPQEEEPELLHSALFDKVLEKVSATKSPALYPQAVTSPDLEEEEAEEEEVEKQVEEEETPDMEVEEEETPDVEEEEEEEEGDADEEDAEEEAVEYIPFEYKGVQYYRDDENQVYQLDEDGDLDDTAPIGVWNPEKQKVLKYR